MTNEPTYVGLGTSEQPDVRIFWKAKYQQAPQLDPMPGDYSWGSDSPGAELLAHKILLHALNDVLLANLLAKAFATSVIAHLPESFKLTQRAVRLWADVRQAHHDVPQITPVGYRPLVAWPAKNGLAVIGTDEMTKELVFDTLIPDHTACLRVMQFALLGAASEGFYTSAPSLRDMDGRGWEAHAEVGLADGDDGVVGRGGPPADAVSEFLDALHLRVARLRKTDCCPTCSKVYP